MRRSRGNRFEPDRAWRFINRLGALTLIAAGFVLSGFALEKGEWAYVLFTIGSIVGAWWWWRTPRAAIEYDSEGVTISGTFLTRRIDRAAILGVEADLVWAAVRWRDSRGWRRTSPLSPLAIPWGTFPLMISSASLDRRRAYLARLDRWARD
ncbi:hypothetical protein MN032_16460 [Agromyces atrinae]|uniref:hypothetical protein n=1 Tax=Agromyces atrinae TaxID=592376 RepID=UPI001F56D2A8|nr:hypothetical protein [Agromyces atrinae]MCI2959281.1 hypothetical protein [Agromyces atrinae]